MAARASKRSSESVTLFSFIGNVGCIRFPEKIRKASGIKRDDRLAVTVKDTHTIVLEKLDIPKTAEIANLKRVDGCSCAEPPAACLKADPALVKVGWSYVELEEPLAMQLGFLPDTPIKLVGEASRITVSLHRKRHDLKDVKRVVCPP
ncbi:MAG TPA: hypothetical protein VE842_11110 [Pyrinomonadaceae bacterium]|jgi:hypothetical protein|nr:hypothetical protein [Pyrinomonadaceae bacterium]